MTPFASDGEYAGIPYRVLVDSSIEAMLPTGLVRFKDMDQFLAAAANIPDINNTSSLTSSDVLDNTNTQRANIPARLRPIDYYSILLEAIHKAENNSVQLRALVYERARFNLKREFLFGYSSLGLSEIAQHVSDFELAIARIEANAEGAKPSSAYRNHVERHEIDRVSSSSADQYAVPVQTPTLFEGHSSYQPTENRKLDWRPNETLRFLRVAFLLSVSAFVAIAFVGAAVIAGVLWRSPKEQSQVEILQKSPSAAEKVISRGNQNQDSARSMDSSPTVSFPLPTSFGIYALSDNKLFNLETLPIKVPDPRVALSAEIKKSSTTIILGNKPAFIIFRRDLLNNAPETVALRVVARIMHETTFIGGKPSTSTVEGIWRVRSTSFRYKVSPVPGQSEMVIARSEDNQSLAAGRYALVLNGFGYDFSIDGPIESSAHCLDAFEALNGTVFSECRKAESADHTKNRL
jgi:hypothetical protein